MLLNVTLYVSFPSISQFLTDNKYLQRSQPMRKMATFMGKLLLFLSVNVSQVKAQGRASP